MIPARSPARSARAGSLGRGGCRQCRPAPARLTAVLLGALAAPGLWGFPWNKDMVDQPSVKPQETKVRSSAAAVPLGQGLLPPVPADPAALVSARLVAGSVVNPVKRSDAAVRAGKGLYGIYCAPCHGASGQGDGPVGRKFLPPPMNLHLDYVQQQPDGQLFYTTSHGSVVMPFYRDALTPVERWQIVHYLKGGLGSE